MKKRLAKHFLITSTFILLFQLSNAVAKVTYSVPLNGKEVQIGNLLKWETVEENNSKTFYVEKAEDGINFEEVGTLAAAGISSLEQGYRFLDLNAGNDKTLYRLRQVDTDGTFSISQTILIHRTLLNNFMVVNMSSSEVSSKLTMTIDVLEKGEIEYHLLNLKNEVIQKGTKTMDFGFSNISIDMENEALGRYQLFLKMGNEIENLYIQRVEDNSKPKDNVAVKNNK